MSKLEEQEEINIIPTSEATEPPKAKQYLLLVDETKMVLLTHVLPWMQYVEVQGMNMVGDEKNMVLVTPKV